MLWEQCVPRSFYDFIKQPENFEVLLSQNVSFKTVNGLIQKFAIYGQNMRALENSFAVYYSTFQYVYSMLFPKYYTQNNKFRMKNKIKFALCYEQYRSAQIGKNPFNFTVEDQVKRHAFEQKPIIIDDIKEDMKTIPDKTKIFLAPPPQPSSYAYAPTMVNVTEFDQKYSLPKVAKKALKTTKKNKLLESIKINIS